MGFKYTGPSAEALKKPASLGKKRKLVHQSEKEYDYKQFKLNLVTKEGSP
jgi:hypothetical protein